MLLALSQHSSLCGRSTSNDLPTALSYSPQPFLTSSCIWTPRYPPVHCSCVSYLHFSDPRLFSVAPFFTFFFIRNLFFTIASKVSQSTKAIQQNWTFLSASLSYLNIRWEEEEASCPEPRPFKTDVKWLFAEIETLDARPTPSVRDLIQLVVLGSNPNLYQVSAVHGKFITKFKLKSF